MLLYYLKHKFPDPEMAVHGEEFFGVLITLLDLIRANNTVQHDDERRKPTIDTWDCSLSASPPPHHPKIIFAVKDISPT